MEHWGRQFAKNVQQRLEGQNDFALDLIDLLQQKAAEFNEAMGAGYPFAVKVTVTGADVEASNGGKSATAFSSKMPGTIFVRVWSKVTERGFDGTLHNTPDGFEADGLPGECADPEKLAEWMIHEIFEP